MEFRHKYGVIGAGAVSRSLIGRLTAKAMASGPVVGVSYRVASRMANSLQGGTAARDAGALNDAAVVLFHAPPDQLEALLGVLSEAPVTWPGRTLIFCDCAVGSAAAHRFRQAGAGVATARGFGLAGRVLLEGAGRGLLHAQHLAKDTQLAAVEIRPGSADVFDAAVTLASCAMTPLIDQAAALLRAAGVREPEAPRLASALVAQTAGGYARSGKQSWAWHAREPELHRVLAEVRAAHIPSQPELIRLLLLFGLELFEKHPELAAALRDGDVSAE